MKSFKSYKRPANTVLVPLYKKGLVFEMTTKEYENIKKDVPAVANVEPVARLDATTRQALWMVGIKAIATRSCMYRLF